ncbi:MAG: hypothetical protein U0L12_02380 [Ruminococcus sp.]|nr:hypothetical protein [Ruminococcus sp.]
MEDRRIRKSKKALKEALCRLVEQKPLADISITELCTEADINRMTFYKNYGTIKEVVKEIYFDYFDEMTQLLPEEWQKGDVKSKITVEAIHFFKENYRRMAVLTENYQSKMFLGLMIDHYLEKRQIQEKDILKRYAFIYDTIGSFAVLTQWLAEECPISEEELAEFVSKMSYMSRSVEV